MSNFTDFFPAAGGGGGGFTKRLKWTTARGLDDANYNNAASYTVNPATDLGLEDGASIGYFMVGGGSTGQNVSSGSGGGGGYGGRIIEGTAIISSASTNLILTPGVGMYQQSYGWSMRSTINPTESTITGGLTITTADGSNLQGTGGYNYSTSNYSPTGGINGYGIGGVGTAQYSSSWTLIGGTAHGFGCGTGFCNYNQSATINWQAGDGAILLFY